MSLKRTLAIVLEVLSRREALGRRFRRLARRESANELDEELRLHIELRTRELVDSGLTLEQARAHAMARFGDYQRVQRECLELDRREAAMERRTEWFADFLRDVRFAVRGLRRQRAFACMAITTLAIGICVVTTVFSAIHSILRPIPGTLAPDHLMSVYRTDAHGAGVDAVSYPEYRAALANALPFAGATAFAVRRLSFRTPGAPATEVSAVLATTNYFQVLGVQAAVGRRFSNSSEIVISHQYWLRHFAGDPRVIGRAVILNSRPVVIVGVTSPGFVGTLAGLRVDLWVALDLLPEIEAGPNALIDRRARFLEVIARLGDARTRRDAEQALVPATQILADLTPASERPNGVGFRLTPARLIPEEGAGAAIGFTTILSALALLVFGVAGLNVAGILLSRGAARRREMGVRIALGAGRARLVRQLLVESILLFACAGALGAVTSVWLVMLLRAYQPPLGLPFELQVEVDATTLAFTVLISLLAGCVFGLAPALESLRTDVRTALTGGGIASASFRRWRVRHAMIIAQISGSLVMLVIAALFARSLQRAGDVPIGFDPEGVVVADIDFGAAGYGETRARAALIRIQSAVATELPSAIVSHAELLPLALSRHSSLVAIDGEAAPQGQDGFPTDENAVGVDYFQALRLPIVAGRPFLASDGKDAPRVAVVNETFASWHFAGSRAVGHTIRLGGTHGTSYSIVGIARDAKYRTLGEAKTAFVYLCEPQGYVPRVSMLVRVPPSYSLGPAAVARRIRQAIAAGGADMPIPEVTQLSSVTRLTLLPQRFAAAAAAILGLIGLLLAALGLYGALAYALVQRTREIGIRLAIGARPLDVSALFLGQGVRLALIGGTIGLLASAAMGRLLASFLLGVSSVDAVAFGSVTTLLAAVAIIASWIPARRAAAMDPAATLRSE